MENLPAEKPPTDLTEKDMERINDFIGSGRPGLTKIDETTLYRMMDLYLSGSTYGQIASTLNLTRPLVMYVAHTYEWYPAKLEYLAEIKEKIKNRVIDSKLVSQDFLLLLTQAWQKKIGQKLKKYLATDDPTHADEINLKEVASLLKTIEMIKELNEEGKDKKGNRPTIGLNVGEGIDLERTGDNKITVTPKQKSIGEMLKKFANERRDEENDKKTNKRSDIQEEDPNKEQKNDQ